MRGSDQRSGALFSYVDLEARVRPDHPLRPIRAIVNAALDRLGPDFAALYSGLGRPSIPPERLLRALLLQAFYGIRSERQIMERLEFDLLFRWFVGLGVDDAVWDQTTFSKNRDRLLAGDVAAGFLAEVLADPKVKRLTSTEHFSVDGTLIEAWASMKSFRRKDGSDEPPAPGRNGERDFHGEKRSNQTHASATDPDARLLRKSAGQEARLCFMGHALMENRNGLVVDACLTRADGHAERVAALAMIEPRADRPGRITLGADKGWAPTRDMTRRTSSTSCGRCVWSHTWRPRPRARQSTGARPAIPAMRRACASANGSRRRLAGRRAPPASPEPGTEASRASAGSSPSPWQPTTSSECQSSWP